MDLDVSGHWGPQFWVWQCSGSSNPAPQGSEVGQLEQQPDSWLEFRAVRDVTIIHRTLGAFGVSFAPTDCNRTFSEQTNTRTKELLVWSSWIHQGNKAHTKPLAHLCMENRQWAELLTHCCVTQGLTSFHVLFENVPGVALSAGLGLRAGRREGPDQSPVCRGPYSPWARVGWVWGPPFQGVEEAARVPGF